MRYETIPASKGIRTMFRTTASTIFILCLAASPAFAAGTPDAVTPDGGRYYGAHVYVGEMRDGMMSGRGRFEVPERDVYEGEFKQDYFWGQGELRSRDGRIYR